MPMTKQNKNSYCIFTLPNKNRKCFTLHRNYVKPRSAGGLTRLLVPNPTAPDKWLTIIEPHHMEQQLMEYCHIHFQQAQGSPYTVPPLSDLLNYDSLTPFGTQVLNGTANLTSLDVSPYAKLLLQHQCTWLPANHQKLQPFPYEAASHHLAHRYSMALPT